MRRTWLHSQPFCSSFPRNLLNAESELNIKYPLVIILEIDLNHTRSPFNAIFGISSTTCYTLFYKRMNVCGRSLTSKVPPTKFAFIYPFYCWWTGLKLRSSSCQDRQFFIKLRETLKFIMLIVHLRRLNFSWI